MQTHFQAYEVHADGFYPDEDLIPDMWQYEKDYATEKERPEWLLVLFILILIKKKKKKHHIVKSVHTVWADILVVTLKYFTVSSN